MPAPNPRPNRCCTIGMSRRSPSATNGRKKAEYPIGRAPVGSSVADVFRYVNESTYSSAGW
jgi:hypothetical protein